ncbi:MAG TPA: PaaI family thioesterase [Rhodocyclaceae bacterium]|nr:PaaI family thioesterase [Rhodocyclaceae bacterium]
MDIQPTRFEARDPDWADKVRKSFARQGVMALLGAELAHLEPGRCEIRLPHRPELTQQHGYFHAGIISTVVDSAGGYAGFSLMPAGSSVLTVEYKLNLLAPGDGELLIAVGEVVKPGKNLVIARGDVYVQRAGVSTRCAIMQQTLMTMHGRDDQAPEPPSRRQNQ